MPTTRESRCAWACHRRRHVAEAPCAITRTSPSRTGLTGRPHDQDVSDGDDAPSQTRAHVDRGIGASLRTVPHKLWGAHGGARWSASRLQRHRCATSRRFVVKRPASPPPPGLRAADAVRRRCGSSGWPCRRALRSVRLKLVPLPRRLLLAPSPRDVRGGGGRRCTFCQVSAAVNTIARADGTQQHQCHHRLGQWPETIAHAAADARGNFATF